MKALARLATGTTVVLVLGMPVTATAHPGNTDSQGGHTCHTNCASWGLRSGQYHYHNQPAPPPVRPAPTPQLPGPAPSPNPGPAPPATAQTARPATQSESEKWTWGQILSAIIFIPLGLVIPFAWGMFIYGAITGKIKDW